MEKVRKNAIIGILLKALLLIAIIGSIAILGYFILKWCGFTTTEDFTKLRDTIGDNIWFWLIISALQVFQVVFIPISNQIITVPIALLFPNDLWKVFLFSWLGIFIGTIILYFLGRFGGEKVLGWLLGDKNKVDRCTNFLKKGKAFYIIGMLIGFIPDDILTTLAGTSKYNFWYVLLVSALTRAICCFASVWGWGFLTRYWWGWLILGVGLSILLTITIILFVKERKKSL